MSSVHLKFVHHQVHVSSTRAQIGVGCGGPSQTRTKSVRALANSGFADPQPVATDSPALDRLAEFTGPIPPPH
jgi:hypothetical protein